MSARPIFPSAHSAAPLVVAFYGDGRAAIGETLFDFFNTVPLFGRRGDLCQIMSQWKSDKGSGWHNYTLLYDFLFRHRRFEVERVFEVGIAGGGSLRGWREYFPRAQIFGADIDRQALFSEERISTFFVNQTDPRAIADMWTAIGPQQFEIIIDDGMHNFEPNSCFFQHSYAYLKPCGYYIIEDIIITEENLQKYHKFFSETGKPGVIVKIPNAFNSYDNCVGIFRG